MDLVFKMVNASLAINYPALQSARTRNVKKFVEKDPFSLMIYNVTMEIQTMEMDVTRIAKLRKILLALILLPHQVSAEIQELYSMISKLQSLTKES
jgi:hypothetical protein